MRTKEYDVNLRGRRLSIVRLKDGAVVAEAEIPLEATSAVVEVLTASDQRERERGRERKPATKAPSAPSEPEEVETKPKKTTAKKTTKAKTSDDESV